MAMRLARRRFILITLSTIILIFLTFSTNETYTSGDYFKFPIMIRTGIELSFLKCSFDGETGDAEPYLWVIYFRIDGTKVKLDINLNYGLNYNKGKFNLLGNATDYVYIEVLPLGWTNTYSHGLLKVSINHKQLICTKNCFI